MRLNVEILIEPVFRSTSSVRSAAGEERRPDAIESRCPGRPITTLAVTEAGCLGVALGRRPLGAKPRILLTRGSNRRALSSLIRASETV